jgi:hypothetical protein
MLHTLGKFSVSGATFCAIVILLTSIFGFTKINDNQEYVYHGIKSL